MPLPGHYPARRFSLRQRNRLRLPLRVELRQDRLERREPGRERVAIGVDGGPKRSGERLALGIGKFKLHSPIYEEWIIRLTIREIGDEYHRFILLVSVG